jgi:hypothetical protein
MARGKATTYKYLNLERVAETYLVAASFVAHVSRASGKETVVE